MIIGFEDAFTEVQADIISLCLEYVNDDVDMIYAFVYQSPTENSFNAFFRKNGAIKNTSHFGDDASVREFLYEGMKDIPRLVDTCVKYDHTCPHEIKMIYNVKNKKFDAHFGYKDYAKDGEVTSSEAFMSWYMEERMK